MFKSLLSFVGSLAVGLSCCFAASSQVPLASAAKPVNRALRVYIFDARETLRLQKLEKQRRHPEPCFCTNIYGCNVAPPLAGRRYFSFDSPPSEIREIDLDGLKKILQRDAKDTRPLLVNFWATWCDPCREEFPDLVKLDADYPSKRLNFVAVSLDDISDIKTAVPKFLKEMNATMPVVLLNVKDPEPAIHVVDEKWDGQLPATFLYDKDGKVVFRHFGRIQPDELRSAIDKQIGGKQ
jgi:thiol-disulfide isomerase/thioredoxin